ncbi:SCO3374 family protein [Streptomyces sp. NPDC058001]|uniref:SCO3374 family protein n=1 Tax=Streptomyces sp. NPDC058001 TaxID=3346300 RepID=UPI0036DFE249
MELTVPHPRRPLSSGDPVRRWYEDMLGWAAVCGTPTRPAQLLTGLRFDVLQMPADAGREVLRRLRLRCPVAVRGRRMWLLVAAGSAEELPGLLDWLEWSTLPLDLAAIGAGGRIDAPLPPGWPVPGGWAGPRGAAVWLRPPEPGRAVEPTLPAPPFLAAPTTQGGGGGAPDLVRLVDTAATQCHRVRLGRARDQRWASSYA